MLHGSCYSKNLEAVSGTSISCQTCVQSTSLLHTRISPRNFILTHSPFVQGAHVRPVLLSLSVNVSPEVAALHDLRGAHTNNQYHTAWTSAF